MFRFQFNPLSIDFSGVLEIHVIEQSSRNKNIDLTTETDHEKRSFTDEYLRGQRPAAG